MRGSNPRADYSTYQFSKLTPSPTWVTFRIVAMGGIEPPTSWIWIKCSPTELHRQLWFHRDSNPNVFSFVAKYFIQLNYETNCCPPRIRTSILWTKTRCTAVIREDNLVGEIGLEPMNSKEGGFTDRCNCRYATLPSKENRRWFGGHLFLRLALLWQLKLTHNHELLTR